MQPLQDDLRDPAAKDNSSTNAATARSNLDAAIAIGSAETELKNTIELRATASEIVAPKPSRAAKDNSITNAATAPSNLDTAITMRSAETELQNTTELRTTASEIIAPKPDLDARAKKKTILKHFLKWFLERKSLAPKWRKSADKSLWQPSCSHSNTIYEIQLQKTIVLPMQPQHQATLTQPLQCDLQRLSCKTQQNYAQRRRKL